MPVGRGMLAVCGYCVVDLYVMYFEQEGACNALVVNAKCDFGTGRWEQDVSYLMLMRLLCKPYA